MTGAPDPTRYLAGGSPRAVLVPARIARLLDREIGAKRAANRGIDPEVDAVLQAVHLAGLEYVERHRGNGSAELPPAADARASTRGMNGHLLDVLAVAARLGCQPRNVRDLAIRGRLRGEHVGRRWQFHPDDVHDYIARRAEESRTG